MPETPEIPEELPLSDVVETEPSASAGGALEIAENQEVAEAAKEIDPMLDVHMPHATHTWKDFFIHLGTITAGLLIAISLEQSVEKLHHLHQRHELEASLRAEGEINKERAEDDFARYGRVGPWILVAVPHSRPSGALLCSIDVSHADRGACQVQGRLREDGAEGCG